MFCVRPRTILMGEKNVTRGVLEAVVKCQSPVLCQTIYQMKSLYVSFVYLVMYRTCTKRVR